MDPSIEEPIQTCDQCFCLIGVYAIRQKNGLSGMWCSDGCATQAWVDMAAQRGVD